MTKSVKNVMKGASGLGTVRARLSCLDAVRSESSLSLNGTLGCAGKKTTMKKLMIAASAALCAAVGFGDGITSANVVGYAQNKLRDGSIGLVPQFLGVGSADGSVDLQSIKCNDASSDSVSLQILNNIGIGGDSYNWINWYDPDGTGNEESCWVDPDYNKVEGFKVQPGQGLWVSGASEEQVFQSAGQVGTSDVAVQLRDGSTMTGNPSPVAIDLQDIRCNDASSDSVSLQILNNIGIGGDSYNWINWYDPDGTGNEQSCWVDPDYNKVEGFKVQPGQGLWVSGASEEQYITFPGVEL